MIKINLIFRTKSINFLSFILLVMIIFFANVSAFKLDEYSAQPLTDLEKYINESPSVAAFGTNVHVVWNTWINSSVSEIYYKKSLDNGNSWENLTRLTYNTTQAIYPVISVFESTIHVAWKDFRNGNPEIYYVNSFDNGNTWNSPIRLTYNSSRSTNIYDISIASDDTHVYVIWKDYRSGSSEIFFKRSINKGKTWFDDQRLTTDYNPSYAPTFDFDKENIYVIFEDRDFKYNLDLLKSLDYGKTWSSKKHILESNPSGTLKNPKVYIENKTLYLVWEDDRSGNSLIYFCKSFDNGESWKDIQQITSSSTCSRNPNIYVSNDNILVIWREQKNGSFNAYYKTSSDRGKNWSEISNVTSNMNCYDIMFTGESNNIHIVWQDCPEPYYGDIWHMSNISYKPDTKPSPENNLIKNTPGFEFKIFLSVIFSLLLTKTIRLKKIKNKKR